jgi:tRNA pseudouridine55 synthase
MTGALIIDKPEGLTSHDIVARVRRAAGTRRVGHAGTLDPFATGVLVVCLERATRLLQFLVGFDKEYLATVRVGFATDTQDYTGKQITPLQSSELMDCERVATVLKEFVGPQWQTPPMFSAKKVAGERLYVAAREGREVERQPVAITVRELELLRLDEMSAEGTRDFLIRVQCSSGTYVRTLAHDIGNRLGTGAYLSALRRTAVGRFRIEGALTLAEVERRGSEGLLSEAMIPPTAMLSHLPMLQIGDADLRLVVNGRELALRSDADSVGAIVPSVMRICDKAGDLVAVGEVPRASYLAELVTQKVIPSSTSAICSPNSRTRALLGRQLNYFDMVHSRTRLACPEKVNEGSRDEITRYNFFADELFGIEGPIAKHRRILQVGGQRLEVRKRILLLMGPVGGGKSTIVTMLKRGLEHGRAPRTARSTPSRIARCTRSRCT